MHYIDTHQHLINRDAFGYSWTNDIPVLSKGNFMPKDFQALTGKRVEKTLFMECAVDDAHYRDEARYFSRLCEDAETGIVGVIASCRPEEETGFDAWLEECQSLNVVGFRRILHVVDDGMSKSDHFRANLRKIGQAGFVFDMCFLARQLPIALELAQACPEMPLVLDHCGVPDIAGGEIENWRHNIHALAGCANVMCKLSGITAYAKPEVMTYQGIKPWVDVVLESFGPERILWGSDWPVVNMAKGLQNWLDISDQILADLSPDEASLIAYKNAKNTYSL